MRTRAARLRRPPAVLCRLSRHPRYLSRVTSFRYSSARPLLLARPAAARARAAAAGQAPRRRRAAPRRRRVLRLPEEGGVARLYRVPVPRSVSPGRPRTSCPPVQRIVGADPEQGLVFALDTQAQSRHARPRDPPGPHLSRAGALGHDGTRRRALRRGHGQHRHPDGPPGAGPVPLEAAGRARGAATRP